MKTILMIIVCVSIFSCSNDSDNSNDTLTADTLEGAWIMSSYESDNDTTGFVLEVAFNSTANFVGNNFDLALIFTENTYSGSGSYDVITTGTANGIPFGPENERVEVSMFNGEYTLVDGNVQFDEPLLIDREALLDRVTITNFVITSSINADGELIVNQTIDIQIVGDEIDSALNSSISSQIVFTRIP